MSRFKDGRIRERLRKARLDRGMTYKELSDKIFIDQGYLCMIERCKCMPSINTLSTICKGLEIDIKDIIDDFIE